MSNVVHIRSKAPPLPAGAIEKRCIQCGKLKPLDDFYRIHKDSEHRQSRCKKCDNGKRATTKAGSVGHRVLRDREPEPQLVVEDLDEEDRQEEQLSQMLLRGLSPAEREEAERFARTAATLVLAGWRPLDAWNRANELLDQVEDGDPMPALFADVTAAKTAPPPVATPPERRREVSAAEVEKLAARFAPKAELEVDDDEPEELEFGQSSIREAFVDLGRDAGDRIQRARPQSRAVSPARTPAPGGARPSPAPARPVLPPPVVLDARIESPRAGAAPPAVGTRVPTAAAHRGFDSPDGGRSPPGETKPRSEVMTHQEEIRGVLEHGPATTVELRGRLGAWAAGNALFSDLHRMKSRGLIAQAEKGGPWALVSSSSTAPTTKAKRVEPKARVVMRRQSKPRPVDAKPRATFGASLTIELQARRERCLKELQAIDTLLEVQGGNGG